MLLTVGEKVVYPGQGPCRIMAVVKRMLENRPMVFYHMVLLNRGSGEVFVPVDKTQAIGLRPLLKKSEIPRLLDQLKQPAKPSDNPRQRLREHLRLLASGSAFDLAEVVESLTEMSETHALSLGGQTRLDKAKRLLICELSEVMRGTKEEAEEEIDKALKARAEAAISTPLTLAGAAKA